MTWLESITLSSSRVRLELLDHRHESDLIEAVKDGELWRLWYTTIPAPDKMAAEIDRRLRLHAAGSMLPFAVIDVAAGKAVGMTTFMNADAVNKRVEIGATWYRRSVQRTDLNTQCKLMLLTHAFEDQGALRVQFTTDGRNLRAQQAIEGLGAVKEGVLRKHRTTHDGSVRDSVIYSILDDEWPAVKERLAARLKR